MPQGTPRPWTPEEDAYLVSAWAQETTLREIAEHLGCGAHHVFERVGALRRAGHPLAQRKPPWTPERRQQLAQLRREGRSLRELELEFERTRGTITSQLRTLARLGYDLGPRGYGASDGTAANC